MRVVLKAFFRIIRVLFNMKYESIEALDSVIITNAHAVPRR